MMQMMLLLGGSQSSIRIWRIDLIKDGGVIFWKEIVQMGVGLRMLMMLIYEEGNGGRISLRKTEGIYDVKPCWVREGLRFPALLLASLTA